MTMLHSDQTWSFSQETFDCGSSSCRESRDSQEGQGHNTSRLIPFLPFPYPSHSSPITYCTSLSSPLVIRIVSAKTYCGHFCLVEQTCGPLLMNILEYPGRTEGPGISQKIIVLKEDFNRKFPFQIVLEEYRNLENLLEYFSRLQSIIES